MAYHALQTTESFAVDLADLRPTDGNGEIRTRGQLPMAEFQGRCLKSLDHISGGASEGSRTLVASLEGCCSTVELHPQHDEIVAVSIGLFAQKVLKIQQY